MCGRVISHSSTPWPKTFQEYFTVDERTRQPLGGKVGYFIAAEDLGDQRGAVPNEDAIPTALLTQQTSEHSPVFI